MHMETNKSLQENAGNTLDIKIIYLKVKKLNEPYCNLVSVTHHHQNKNYDYFQFVNKKRIHLKVKKMNELYCNSVSVTNITRTSFANLYLRMKIRISYQPFQDLSHLFFLE